MSHPQSPLRDSALYLAVITAILYCISTAHAEGYMSALLLDANILERDFHQVLYHGLIVSFAPAFKFLFVLTCVSYIYSHGALPDFVKWLKRSKRNKRKFIKFKSWFTGRKGSAAEAFAKQRTIKALRCSFLALMFLFSLAYFERQGKAEALTLLSKIESKEQLPQSTLVNVKIGEAVKDLVYLGCGARNCAGMDVDSKIVHYFPQGGHSYQYMKGSVQAENSTR